MRGLRRAVAVGCVALLGGLAVAVANDVAPFSDDLARISDEVAPFSDGVAPVSDNLAAVVVLPRPPRFPVPRPRPTFRIPVPDPPTPPVPVPVPFPDPPTPRGPFPDVPLPTGAPPPADMVDALTDPRVSPAVKRAISMVRAMAVAQTEDEKVIARATCKMLNAAVAVEPEHTLFKERILEQVEPSTWWPSDLQEYHAEKVANALTVAHHNARAGLWYVHYCLRPW